MKKSNVERVLSIIIVIMLLGSILAGCAGKPDVQETTQAVQSSASQTETKPVQEDLISEEPVTFTLLYNDNPSYPFNEDWEIFKEIQKRTNVTIDCQIVSVNDYETKKKLLLNSGSITDLFLASTSGADITDFALNGILLPISDYMDKMPNLSNMIKDMNLDQDIKNLLLSDGKMYTLPRITEVPAYSAGLAIRMDILKKLGLDVPKTYDDLYNAMKKMKESDPKCLPLTMFLNMDYLTMFMEPSWHFERSSVNGMSLVYYDLDDKKYVSSVTSPKYRSFLTYMNKLYTEGLLDPEAFTQDLDQWSQKIVTGKSLVTAAWCDQIDTINSAGKQANPDYNLENLFYLTADDSMLPKMKTPHADYGWAIPSSAKSKPYFDKLLKFVDWFFYSKEGYTLANWGVENLTYKVDNGKNVLLADSADAKDSLSKSTQIKHGLYNYSLMAFTEKDRQGYYIGSKAAAFTQMMVDNNMFVPTAPSAKFSIDISEQVDLLAAPIKDYCNKANQAFILGKLDPQKDWDSYVKDVEAKGIDKVVNYFNEAIK